MKKLTPAALQEHNNQGEEENDKLNTCVRGALKQMDAQVMVLEEQKFAVQALGVEAGRGEKMKKLVLEELEEKLQEIGSCKTELRQMLFTQQDAAHKDAKVSKLTAASALIIDAKEVVMDAKRLLKQRGGSSAAGSVAA